VNVSVSDKSPKVDKPLSPYAEKTVPECLTPPSLKDTQHPPSASGAPSSPTHVALGHDLACASSGLELTESCDGPPLSPWSNGLRAPSGFHLGESSSAPRPEKHPQQHSWVEESLFDNLEFIQPMFHLGRFITVAIDTEADQVNIKALYFELEATSSRIDVSILVFPHCPFSAWI
jgi:hypothetical protein